MNVVSPMHYLFSVGSKSHLKSSSPSKVNPHNDEKSDCRRKERKWKKIGLHLFLGDLEKAMKKYHNAVKEVHHFILI